jgi:phosphate acetyltransferase
MPLLPKLIERLQRHPKRIVFPEGADPRILQAARQWVTRRMGAPILLGDRARIKEAAAQLDVNLAGMRLIEPGRSEDFDGFVSRFEELRHDKGLKPGDAETAMLDNNYFATMMLATGQVDALVGGATVMASSALRPLFQIIPRLENVATASSLLILDWDEQKVGIDGSIFLADCGVIPDPTAEQLADIAIATAMIAHHLTNELPRVAMLSYSSKSASDHPAVVKMRTATELARAKAARAALPMEVDGELQVDAALDPHVAENKKVAGAVGGRANVLIFPDLASWPERIRSARSSPVSAAPPPRSVAAQARTTSLARLPSSGVRQLTTACCMARSRNAPPFVRRIPDPQCPTQIRSTNRRCRSSSSRRTSSPSASSSPPRA